MLTGCEAMAHTAPDLGGCREDSPGRVSAPNSWADLNGCVCRWRDEVIGLLPAASGEPHLMRPGKEQGGTELHTFSGSRTGLAFSMPPWPHGG